MVEMSARTLPIWDLRAQISSSFESFMKLTGLHSTSPHRRDVPIPFAKDLGHFLNRIFPLKKCGRNVSGDAIEFPNSNQRFILK